MYTTTKSGIVLLAFLLVQFGLFSCGSGEKTESLIAQLQSDDHLVRIEAEKKLAQRQDIEVVAAIVEALKILDDRGKIHAKQALVDLGPFVVETLIHKLKELPYETCVHVVDVLADIKDPRAIMPLIELVERLPVKRRNNIERTILKIGKPAYEVLLQTTQSDNLFLKAWAVQMLGQLKDPRSVQPLIQQLITSDDRDTIIAQALSQFEAAAYEPLIAIVENVFFEHSYKEQLRAIWALGYMPYSKPKSYLKTLLDDVDEDIRKEARSAFNRLTNSRTSSRYSYQSTNSELEKRKKKWKKMMDHLRKTGKLAAPSEDEKLFRSVGGPMGNDDQRRTAAIQSGKIAERDKIIGSVLLVAQAQNGCIIPHVTFQNDNNHFFKPDFEMLPSSNLPVVCTVYALNPDSRRFVQITQREQIITNDMVKPLGNFFAPYSTDELTLYAVQLDHICLSADDQIEQRTLSPEEAVMVNVTIPDLKLRTAFEPLYIKE